MDSINDCSKDELDLAEHSRMEGFPDHKAMSKNRFVIAGIQLLLLILGLGLNFAICYVMVTRRKVKKSLSNFFLFNLSLTELILWVVVLPMTMTISMTKINSSIPCKVLVFSIFTCAGVIFGLLAALALDRYTNIITPLRAITMDDRKVASLVIIWLVAIATSAPFLYSVGMRTVSMEFHSTSDEGVVTVKMTLHGVHDVKAIGHARNVNVTRRVFAKLLKLESGGHGNVSSLNATIHTRCILPMQLCDIPANLKGQLSCIAFVLVSFLSPLIFISFAYIKIVQRLWLRSRAHDAQGQAAKATLRAVRLLVLVVLSFLVTDGPWVLGSLLYSFRSPEMKSLESHFTVVAIVTTLFYASAVVTPSVHVLHSSTVKNEIYNVLCCRSRDKSFSATSTSSLVSNSRRFSSMYYAKNNDKLADKTIKNN